ncbi:unnamed protein product [Cuscuta europaea]|uniref:Uncharacterized protein n=1 Tax=Cuscuta europaea TaxID=41803 RepID=A0A9P1EH70_CUSEU|nr:unnamed protein product [Cuscuta europaea]
MDEIMETPSMAKELEAAKRVLSSLKEEGFKCMASLDDIRGELKHVSYEKGLSKKKQQKSDLIIQKLNSKLLEANAKLEATSLSQEKVNSLSSNLSLTLEQAEEAAGAAQKESAAAMEETEKIKEEIKKTDLETSLAKEKLQSAVKELKKVKSSEGSALENLRALVGKTVMERASMKSSKVVISRFEYEYLMGNAAMAEEIADKKVAAAEAWVRALKESEKEILMRTEMLERETRELKADYRLLLEKRLYAKKINT